MKNNEFMGALIFLALSLLIFALGIPTACLVSQLGYSSNFLQTFLEFN